MIVWTRISIRVRHSGVITKNNPITVFLENTKLAVERVWSIYIKCEIFTLDTSKFTSYDITSCYFIITVNKFNNLDKGR